MAPGDTMATRWQHDVNTMRMLDAAWTRSHKLQALELVLLCPELVLVCLQLKGPKGPPTSIPCIYAVFMYVCVVYIR